MDPIKKVAIAVIVASLVIGSAFGLITSSSTPTNQKFLITANVILTKSPTSCPNMPTNYTEWAVLHVYANQTNLFLVSMTGLTAKPSLSVTITLDENESSYVYYRQDNITSETVYVPLPDYWSIGEDVILSATYYYGGINPTSPIDYGIGAIPVDDGTVSC